MIVLVGLVLIVVGWFVYGCVQDEKEPEKRKKEAEKLLKYVRKSDDEEKYYQESLNILKKNHNDEFDWNRMARILSSIKARINFYDTLQKKYDNDSELTANLVSSSAYIKYLNWKHLYKAIIDDLSSEDITTHYNYGDKAKLLVSMLNNDTWYEDYEKLLNRINDEFSGKELEIAYEGMAYALIEGLAEITNL